MENFGERIAKLRKEKGYTQNQLADKIGVSNKSVSRWETNEGFPDITILVPLADALGVSVDVLLRDQGGFRDIQKKDFEKFLPFGICLIGTIIFFILQKVGVNVFVNAITYLVLMYIAKYVLDHHTDKAYGTYFVKLQTLFHFLVFNSIISSILMFVIIIIQSGMNIFMIFGTNISMDDFNLFDQISTVYVLSFIFTFTLCVVYYQKHIDEYKK